MRVIESEFSIFLIPNTDVKSKIIGFEWYLAFNPLNMIESNNCSDKFDTLYASRYTIVNSVAY